MSTEQPTSSDRYADALRARFEAAAPALTAEPTPIIARARRRRRQVRTWGVLGVVAALVGVAGLANALANRDPSPPVAPPPVVATTDYWVTSGQVRPGDDLVAVAAAEGGVVGTLSRWDGGDWAPYRLIRFCPDHWGCHGSLEPYAESYESQDLLILPGTALRFSTQGLDLGWYRVGDSGQFEITAEAPAAAPLWPVDAPALSVSPALVPRSGGEVTLFPLAPSDTNGMLTHDDLAAVTAGMPETVAIERWEGAAWTPAVEVGLRGVEGDDLVRYADLPGLDPGAYRLVRTGPAGSVTGNFWVATPADIELQDVVVLERLGEYPAGVDPHPVDGPPSGPFGAIVHPDDRAVEVYSTGSGSCPYEPTALAVQDGVLVIYLGDVEEPPADRVCTADASPITFVIELPDEVPTNPVPRVELRARRTGEVITGSAQRLDPDAPQICVPGMSDDVCALNLWLDQLTARYVVEATSPGANQLTIGSRTIVQDGSVVASVEAFPTGTTPPGDPLELTVRETYDAAEDIAVELGDFVGPGGGPGGRFACGAVEIRVVGIGLDAQAADAVVWNIVSAIGGCPDDVGDLVDRYVAEIRRDTVERYADRRTP